MCDQRDMARTPKRRVKTERAASMTGDWFRYWWRGRCKENERLYLRAFLSPRRRAVVRRRTNLNGGGAALCIGDDGAHWRPPPQ
jgi:hypothetical protein